MRVRIALVALTFVAVAFAGCAGDDPAPSTAIDCSKPENAADSACVPDVKVDAKTGAIRCVVVDSAVRPLANVRVSTLVAGRGQVVSNTTANGACSFTGLPEGTYFLKASKKGYHETQTSVEVRAGVTPPVTKIQLATDIANTPYSQAFTFSGYIECSVTSPGLALAVCDVPNIAQENTTNDRFIAFHALDRKPSWVQHELVWESTQQTGNTFQLVSSYSTIEQHNEGSYEGDLNSTIGTSPLLLVPTKGDIDRTGVGENGTGLVPRIFAGGMEGSQVCDPTGGNFGGTLRDNCLFGTGATVEQSFTLYTHVFYGYEPTSGWRFSEDSNVPPPPQ